MTVNLTNIYILNKIYKSLYYYAEKIISIKYKNKINILEYIIKLSNKEFIKLFVDEKKIFNNYEKLLLYNKNRFLFKIYNIIDNDKYLKYNINKYILDYDYYINHYNINKLLKHPYILNYKLDNRCIYFT